MTAHEVLRKYFGHAAFRPGQEALIDALTHGRDAFGIMPTGGGKSLCYQVPALMQDGVTLVISPLISLMKDQVMALKTAGVKAAFLNSSLTGEQLRTAYRNLRAGDYKIVYLAPERLEGDGFTALAKGLDIALVAVDEAHCISQWGQDFRPSYLRILDFLDKLPRRPVLAAFTATATEQVRDDIVASLKLRSPLCVVTGFDRPNLNFEVRAPKGKFAALRALVLARRNKSGIVYCATRKNVEQVCDGLCALGLPATRYHAGLTDEERRRNQEDFLYDRSTVMVATNAFGMGIDKSNVSFVIHYNMPKSVEAYYQEAGRAGRDGQPADCFLLFSGGDVQTAKFLIQTAGENGALSDEERQDNLRRELRRLDDMVAYCKTTGCLRSAILDYFNQDHPPQCGNCGNCRSDYTVRDITAQAQMILSCVKRVRDKLGYSVGAALIAEVLAGSRRERVMTLGLDGLSTHGLMRTLARPQIRAYLDHLIGAGYLTVDPAHGGIALAPTAADVLFRGETVDMRFKQAPAPDPAAPRLRPAAPRPAADDEDTPLFEALRALRTELARSEGVPAYVVFSNATLVDMAAKAPRTMDEFLEVTGVGAHKAARYGERFLALLQEEHT